MQNNYIQDIVKAINFLFFLNNLASFCSQDTPLMVPLTARSVTSLHKVCPDLQCVGDLKYWALTSAQRRKLSRDLGCTLSIAK